MGGVEKIQLLVFSGGMTIRALIVAVMALIAVFIYYLYTSEESAMVMSNANNIVEVDNEDGQRLGEAVLEGNVLKITIPKEHESKLQPSIKEVQVFKVERNIVFKTEKKVFHFTQDEHEKTLVEHELEPGKYNIQIVMKYLKRNLYDYENTLGEMSYGFPVKVE